MLNLVFLPATEPGDPTYGVVPQRIEAHPDAAIHQVRYPAMVWYNQPIRREAVAQIRALDVARVVLVGFSKSGLGAWNVARMIPDLVVGTIIFDSPVALDERLSPQTDAWYDNDDAWREDVPLRTVEDFQAVIPKTHRLVLISGQSFHAQMCLLARALSRTTVNHLFLPRPHLAHHWQAGWIEEGLDAMLQMK